MRALHARVGCSGPTRGQNRRFASSPGLPLLATRLPATTTRRMTTRAFQTSFAGGGETRDHDGSSPYVVPVGGERPTPGAPAADLLRLEERGGRVYARVVTAGGVGSEGASLAPAPTGVYYSGSELRPECDYLLSPGGAVLEIASSPSPSLLTVSYEVRDDDGGRGGIGALGEMLARSMMAQSSKEVRAKLDDVF